jgi:triphosphatase
LQLYKTVKLEIGTASKAERGYGLIDPHSAPAARRQEPIELAPSCSADAVLRLIGRSCLGHLLNNIPAALAGEEEGIHQMRVAARRLRSLLSAARKLLPDGQQRWASQELRHLANALGGARSWDSVTNSLIPDAQAGLAQPHGLELLAAAAAQCRTVAYQEAQDAIRSRRYGQSILRLLRWFETGGWRDEASRKQAKLLQESAEPTAARLLDRCLEQVRKRSRNFDEQSPAERHKLRIAVKKLRYNIAFFTSLYPPKKSERFVARLKPLQDALGRANDVRTAPRLMQDLKRPAGDSRARLEQEIGLLLGWHARGVKDCEPQTTEALRQLLDAKPFWR